MEQQEKSDREKYPIFFKLWDIKCVQKYKEEDKGKNGWNDYTFYATTTKDVTMSVWNGRHEPSVDANCKNHICKAGTRVLIWMVSRFGDVGITDNLIDALGYNVRIDADEYLTDLEIIEKMKNKELNELSVVLQSITKLTAITIWIFKLRKIINEVVVSILGMAWASMLLMYIVTDNTIYLKVFFGVISLGLMFYFIIVLLEFIGQRKRDNYIASLDMAKLDKPFPTDINNTFFYEEESIKYIVTDKSDPLYKSILFLYPMYGRLNQNRTITFFRKNQIEQIKNN